MQRTVQNSTAEGRDEGTATLFLISRAGDEDGVAVGEEAVFFALEHVAHAVDVHRHGGVDACVRGQSLLHLAGELVGVELGEAPAWMRPMSSEKKMAQAPMRMLAFVSAMLLRWTCVCATVRGW